MSQSNEYAHMHLLQSLEVMSNRILPACSVSDKTGMFRTKGCVRILLADGPVGGRQKIARSKLQARATDGRVPEGPIRSVCSAVVDRVLWPCIY